MFNRLMGRANDIGEDVTPLQIPHWLQKRIELMKAAVASRLSMAQQRYKREFDSNVQRAPTLKVVNNVFVDRLQLSAIGSGAADEMASL